MRAVPVSRNRERRPWQAPYGTAATRPEDTGQQLPRDKDVSERKRYKLIGYRLTGLACLITEIGLTFPTAGDNILAV